MLQSLGSQIVQHHLVTEQQQPVKKAIQSNTCIYSALYKPTVKYYIVTMI